MHKSLFNREKEFWQSAKAISGGIKLLVKRVFITSDFGENGLPKWISWLRVIVDGSYPLRFLCSSEAKEARF